MHSPRIASYSRLLAVVSVGLAADPAASPKSVAEPALPDGTDAAKQMAAFKFPRG